MGARLELLIRLLMSFVLGIIFWFWSIWAGICWCLQFLIILVTGKRNASIHKQIEKFFKFYVKSYEYLMLLTDKRPL